MANSLTRVEQIAWEKGCEAFENNNVFAKNAEVYKPESGFAEQAGQTIRFPYANQIEFTTGLDVTNQQKDITDVTVPLSLNKSDIVGSRFGLDVIEGNFERRITDNVMAAVRRTSGVISTRVSEAIIDKGALVGTSDSDLVNYSDFAKAGTILSEIEAGHEAQYMYLPPRMAQGLANELGSRETDNGRDMDAYGMGKLPSINSFMTFKSNSLKTVAGVSATGITVAGADQNVTPVAYESDTTPAAGTVDDPRKSVLAVSDASGLSEGAAFTIADVNRVGIDTKVDTGQLATFRVLAVDGNNVTVSPAIMSDGAYQNVSAAPADGAAVTVITTEDAQPAVFTTKGAVQLFCSDINWGLLEGSAATILGEYTTTSGLSIALIRQGSGLTGAVDYRFAVWARPNVVDPTKCGILLPNQAANL